jgi:hypothetical protein
VHEAELKADAAFQIDSGIMQRKFALAYMQKQLAELPVPAEDAPEKDKQAYAREKVKIDAMEAEIERQEEYREFIRDTIHV